jgi:ribosome-associated protein
MTPRTQQSESKKQILEALAAAESKKAESISILELDKASGSFTDYFVICSGSNPRQIQAISDEVEQRLAKAGTRPAHVEGYRQAEWVLLDYVDFVVHVFSEKAREFYGLERLWKSAKQLEPSALKTSARKKSTPASAKKSPAKKTAAKKTAAKKTAAKKASGTRTSRARKTPAS